MLTLKEKFENTAEWRRQKATEYPDDTRNVEAATLLDRLAQSAGQIAPAFATAYDELVGDDENDGLRFSEFENEKLRSIGFHCWPASAEDFAKGVIAKWTGG